MTFLLDTGSSYFWFPLVNCTQCYTTNLYDPSGVSTFVATTTSGEVSYGSGNVSGKVATEDVYVAFGGDPATMKVLGVDYEDSSIDGLPSDGIVGLAPMARSSTDLFVNQLYVQGVIPKNAFGIDLRDSSDSVNSSITFGGYDTSIVTDSAYFTYVNLIDTAYWSLKLRSCKYGDSTIDIVASRAIIDTGASLVYFSSTNGDWDLVYSTISSGKTCGYNDTSARYY